ncbi:uncharacterized protein LOC123887284 [Trifolium pratense]|nr:uncharacterized protein LOC123887284 [Trifolium pratense]
MASNFCKPSRRDNSLIIKTSKYPSKPPTLMLKDYLRDDDLSSCSSSGFKSFPRRRQYCCTTVGFLPEKDLQLKHKKRKTKTNTNTTKLPRRRPTLERASEAVITAIKSLSSSQKKANSTTGVLSRSFSRKLLSRKFWRKAVKEQGSEGVLKFRRPFRELLMQERDYKPTSFSAAKSITSVSSGCCSNSWGETEFTFTSNATSSDSSSENELVDGGKDGAPPQHKIEGDWSNEKEQFSPVSILDCPFEDEEEIKSHSIINSFFQGAENKHMQKTRHFENVAASLEPLVLEKRIQCLELEDELNNKSTKQCSALHSIIRNNEDEDELNILKLVKSSIPSNSLMINTEKLLFDYLEQSIEENNKDNNYSKKFNLCNVVEDWIQGHPQEPYLGWEVKEGRHVYINEMEKSGDWKNSDQETEQLVLELENEVLTSFVDEIVLDLVIC